MHVHFTHEQIADHARKRPADYLDQLMQAAVTRDERGVMFDTEHVAWKMLEARHRSPQQQRPSPTVRQIASLTQARMTGRRVSLEVMQQRLAICAACDQLRHDERGTWCGACGCGLSHDHRAVRNLAAFEERLPQWGCKHPRRGEGAGWRG